jgi:hypothetical protein
MDILFKCLHGSHLFGTQNESSDKDYKIVICHDLDSLIINPWETDRTKDVDKNEESEIFSVKRYATMLKQQQTVALEMLFAPPSHWVEFHSAWEVLQNNREKCISKNILPFVKYAKEQARLYSEKGNSYSVMHLLYEDIHNFMYSLPSSMWPSIKAHEYVKSPNFIRLVNDNPTVLSFGVKYLNKSSQPTPYTMILNKQFENHIPVKEWHDRIKALVNSFGERTRKAAAEGMDRKAMSAAVRIIYEAIELLTTGKLTFPRPEVDLLREIRYNEAFSYEQTSELISNLHDKLLLEVAPMSKLQATPDETYLTQWYVTTQSDYILDEYMS